LTRPGTSTSPWAVLLLAWLGWVFDVADTAIFNLAKVPMLTGMLGVAEYARRGTAVEAQIQTVFLIGWSIGGLGFGILADRWGRTRTLVLTVLLYCLCTGLTVLCKTPEQVAVARFLTALGIGGEWAAGAALVAETFADGFRPTVSSLLQTAAAFGPMLAAVANLLLAGKPWQWLFLVGILPALVCCLARLGAHDSKPVMQKKANPLRDLWNDPALRRRAGLAMIVGAVGIAGAGTASFWQPNLVKEVSIGVTKQVLDARTSHVTLISHLGTLAGVFAVPWLCRVFGRKPTIAAFYVATPLVVIVALGTGTTYVRLELLLPMVNFFAIGVSGAFVLYFPELFPSDVRATGAGLAYNVGRILSVPMPLATAWAIRQYGGSIATGVVLSGSVYLLGLIAIPFLPETKGKPLPA